MVADFAMASVTLNMDMTVNGNNYATTNLPMNIGMAPNDFTFSGSGATTNSTNCIFTCTTFVEGFFAGSDGSHAGLACKTDILTDFINRAAAFKKD